MNSSSMLEYQSHATLNFLLLPYWQEGSYKKKEALLNGGERCLLSEMCKWRENYLTFTIVQLVHLTSHRGSSSTSPVHFRNADFVKCFKY